MKLVKILTGTSLFLLAAQGAAAKPQLINFDHPHVPGEYIVKFKEGRQRLINQKESMYNATILYEFSSSGAQLIKFDHAELLDNSTPVPESLLNDPDIESIEANTIVRLEETPNDNSYEQLYALPRISAPGAWDISHGSHEVRVAVIDSGIDYNHPDLQPNIWQNPGEVGLDAAGNDKRFNGIDDDRNGYVDDYRGWNFVGNNNDPMDYFSHGTHCAGTIGAVGNNEIGVVGVNWKVSLVAIKIFSAKGASTLAGIIRAVEYANQLGVDIISASWIVSVHSPSLYAAVQRSYYRNILFVAAAGNYAGNNDAYALYPAGYQLGNMISVAATTANDYLASFSNYGANTVHLAAPGAQILSTTPRGAYAPKSGTSMATPHVAGAAALIKAVYPKATALQIKRKLLLGTDRFSSLRGRTITGGRLNIYKALNTSLESEGSSEESLY